jgi:ABC-type phosphate transport system substrate-binding protein
MPDEKVGNHSRCVRAGAGSGLALGAAAEHHRQRLGHHGHPGAALAIRHWKEVGGRDERIILYSRENNSGTYVYFKEHVLGNADFFPTAQTLPGTAAVINAVAKDRRGIGYGGIAYGKGIKHLLVTQDAGSPAVDPTLENVLSARYPISRYLYWYLTGQPTGEVKKFVEWVLSKEGQAVVENVGYYPLPEKARVENLAKLTGAEGGKKPRASGGR